MRKLRKILFYAFTGIYLTCCPLIILYAFGYIFKTGTKWDVVKTGLVYIATIPEGANIYLGGRRHANKTPVSISNLMPGEYKIRLAKKGYHSWENRILIKEKRATVLDKILMIPNEWEKEPIFRNVKNIIPSVDGESIKVLRSGKEKPPVTYNCRTETKAGTSQKTIISKEKDLAALDPLKKEMIKQAIGVVFSEENKKGLIWNRKTLGIFKANEEEPAQEEEEITWIYTGTRRIDQAFWVHGASHVLFKAERDIYLMDVGENSDFAPVLVAETTRRGNIFYLEEKGKLYFIGGRGGSLYALKIMPEKNLIPQNLLQMEKEKKNEV